MRLPVAALALLLGTGGGAVPALAASEITPTGADPSPQTATDPLAEFAGPVLAGDAVVWAEQRLDGTYRVIARDASGRRELARGATRRSLSLDGAPTLVGLLTERELFSGPPAGDLSSAADCTTGCGGVAVTDGALAFQRARGDARAVDVEVINLSPDGTASTRTFRDAPGHFALAGRFLATENFDKTRLTVYDRISGETVYSLARAGYDFDVQADGTTVFQTSRTQLAYATVAEPRPHPLSLGQSGPGERSDSAVSLAGDRVVIGNGRRFTLETLAGAVRDLPELPALQGGFDFDGRRLAFAVKPCLVTSVVTWDVDDATFPATPGGPCRAARIASVSRRVSARSKVAVRLACPADPLLGCPGFVDLGGDRVRFYNLRPGRSTTLSVALDPAQRRQLRRRGSLVVRVRSEANSSAVEGNTRTTLRARLRAR